MHTSSADAGPDHLLALCDDKLFALPAGQLLKVVGPAACALRPELPEPFLGWADLGARCVPLARLGAYCGAAMSMGFERALVVDAGGVPLALAVDAVHCITAIDEAEVGAPAAGDADVVSGVWQSAERTVLVLDPSRLADEARRGGVAIAPWAPSARAAPAGGLAGGPEYCLFERRSQRFALPAWAAVEVVSCPQITPVPQAPEALLGVTRLRGEPLAVFHLDAVLGVPAAEAHLGGPVLVIASRGIRFGVAVDRVEAIGVIDGAGEPPGATAVRVLDVDLLLAAADDLIASGFASQAQA